MADDIHRFEIRQIVDHDEDLAEETPPNLLPGRHIIIVAAPETRPGRREEVLEP